METNYNEPQRTSGYAEQEEGGEKRVENTAARASSTNRTTTKKTGGRQSTNKKNANETNNNSTMSSGGYGSLLQRIEKVEKLEPRLTAVEHRLDTCPCCSSSSACSASSASTSSLSTIENTQQQQRERVEVHPFQYGVTPLLSFLSPQPLTQESTLNAGAEHWLLEHQLGFGESPDYIFPPPPPTNNNNSIDSQHYEAPHNDGEDLNTNEDGYLTYEPSQYEPGVFNQQQGREKKAKKRRRKEEADEITIEVVELTTMDGTLVRFKCPSVSI